jgi:hypothetical protein
VACDPKCETEIDERYEYTCRWFPRFPAVPLFLTVLPFVRLLHGNLMATLMHDLATYGELMDWSENVGSEIL